MKRVSISLAASVLMLLFSFTLEDGGFLYTPRPNRKGRDYFGYRVIDEAGNVSQEATGLIRIET